MSNNFGLALSSMLADVVANLPTDYPGTANIALYYATDTGTLYLAAKPTFPATAATWNVISGGNYVAVPDAATYTVLAANSGKVHVMPNLTADDAIALPLPTAGLKFEFIYGGVAVDAQSWLFRTPAAANFYVGGLLHMDTNAGAGSDELVPVYPNGSTNAKLTVALPQVGTRIRFIADGTHWIVDGAVSSDTAPAFADLP